MSTYDLEGTRHLVLVCTGSSCRKEGADGVVAACRAECKERGLRADVHVVRARCLGRCDDACNVVVASDGTWYGGVTAKGARRIVREHLEAGVPVAELVTHDVRGDKLRHVGRGKRGKSRK
jgi:(2Fe-2S) ferredoxin